MAPYGDVNAVILYNQIEVPRTRVEIELLMKLETFEIQILTLVLGTYI